METTEFAGQPPESPIPSEQLIEKMSPEQQQRLKEAVTGQLIRLGGASISHEEQINEETKVLKGILSKSKGGSSGPDGHQVDLGDPDKLWLATNILYSASIAAKVYQIAREAQISAFGNEEDQKLVGRNDGTELHQELVQDLDTLDRFDARQVLAGEGAVLRLMDEAMAEEAGESPVATVIHAAPWVEKPASGWRRLLNKFRPSKKLHQQPGSPVDQEAAEPSQSSLTPEQIQSFQAFLDAQTNEAAVPVDKPLIPPGPTEAKPDDRTEVKDDIVSVAQRMIEESEPGKFAADLRSRMKIRNAWYARGHTEADFEALVATKNWVDAHKSMAQEIVDTTKAATVSQPTAGVNESVRSGRADSVDTVNPNTGSGSDKAMFAEAETKKVEPADSLEGRFQEVKGFFSDRAPELAANIEAIASEPALSEQAAFLRGTLEKHLEKLSGFLPAEDLSQPAENQPTNLDNSIIPPGPAEVEPTVSDIPQPVVTERIDQQASLIRPAESETPQVRQFRQEGPEVRMFEQDALPGESVSPPNSQVGETETQKSDHESQDIVAGNFLLSFMQSLKAGEHVDLGDNSSFVQQLKRIRTQLPGILTWEDFKGGLLGTASLPKNKGLVDVAAFAKVLDQIEKVNV